MKTNDLRKLIKSQLDSVATSYYHDAPDSALFPHIVFDFETIDLGDYYRADYSLTIDVWNKNNQALTEQMADDVCELLQLENLPQLGFLPTFYRESRRNLRDEDGDINHIQIEYIVQCYDR